MTIVKNLGRTAFENLDDTRRWIEGLPQTAALDGRMRPNLVVRYATDTNFVYNSNVANLDPSKWSEGHWFLYDDFVNGTANTRSIMNLALPGQQMRNVLSWQVQETTDNLVQTASFDCVNAMQYTTTRTTLTTALQGDIHSLAIQTSYVQNSLGTMSSVNSAHNVAHQPDPTYSGVNFYEANVKYRQFRDQTFAVQDGSAFPDPAIPNDDDNDVPDDTSLPHSSGGIGAYFVKIDDEVMRVYWKSGNTFGVRPGGRGINGVIQAHSPGAQVILLDIGETTGEWCSLGFLNLDDYAPQQCLIRPGTCFSVYEGYGTMPNLLKHDFGAPGHTGNYDFTGYWFVSGVESSMQEDGVPHMRVDLKNVGNILDQQKITPDLVQRIKGKFGTWKIRAGGDFNGQGESIFGSADHSRDIPGDWVDYNDWDSSLPDSYPLKIKTELAQHKEFFDHMRDTNLGLDCEFCQQEQKEFLKQHPTINKTDLSAARAVGKHIYKQSIRVYRDAEDGPLRTYVRLMATLAAAGWEHPALGLELAQRFSKLPANLYDNIRNLKTGLVFCGQPDVKVSSSDMDFSWESPTYDDATMWGNVGKLMCPFESSYDKSPFSQPMQDLADTNGMQFWVNRQGYPVFMPRAWSLRPNGMGFKDLNLSVPYKNELDGHSTNQDQKATIRSWFLASGGSLNGYSHSTQPEAVLSQVWVTATTAFDSTFTTSTSGTGWSSDGKQLLYSALGGNREALSLTSGVQQVDTVTLDNLSLGLDWDTNPANWGVKQQFDGNTKVLNPLPQRYDGTPTLSNGSSGEGVKRVQQTINFFIIRRYIEPVQDPNHSSKYWYSLDVDGKYGDITGAGVKELKKFLKGANFDHSQLPSDATPLDTSDPNYGRNIYLWLKTYLDQASDYIKMDVWWYVQNGRDWLEYVAAVTGVAIPLKASKNTNVTSSRTSKHYIDTPRWVVDDKGMKAVVAQWQKTFIKTARNVGNKTVDDSVNKATVRSVTANYADPRIQAGDVIWCTVPGFLGMGNRAPYKNGIFITNLQRQMDILNGTYSATYSGYRYRSGLNYTYPTPAFQFIKATN